MIEIEVKFPLHDEEAYVTKILNEGFTESKRLIQTDTYLNSKFHRFEETDEALRIRESSSTTELTYKGPKTSVNTKLREEISVQVSSSDDLLSIFERLGFYVVAQVNKERRVFKKQNIEVTVDRVQNLGTFTEIELVIGDSEDKELKEHELLSLCKRLDLDPSNQIRLSYLELLIKMERR